MIIRSATLDDLDAILGLFRESVTWLAERGIDQWQKGPPIRRIRQTIEDGTVFVGEDETGAIIATVTVDAFADPDFWGPDDDPESALYVHRMIVARDHAGTGVGDQLTEWMTELAGALGYERVRLDCWRSNTALQRYYADHGWRWVRTEHPPWRPSGALFERPTVSQRVPWPNGSSTHPGARGA